jgi:hypothetical protein
MVVVPNRGCCSTPPMQRAAAAAPHTPTLIPRRRLALERVPVRHPPATSKEGQATWEPRSRRFTRCIGIGPERSRTQGDGCKPTRCVVRARAEKQQKTTAFLSTLSCAMGFAIWWHSCFGRARPHRVRETNLDSTELGWTSKIVESADLLFSGWMDARIQVLAVLQPNQYIRSATRPR